MRVCTCVWVKMCSVSLVQEVDNWTALVADVDEVFASRDVGRMAAKIQGMQQSLVRITCNLAHERGWQGALWEGRGTFVPLRNLVCVTPESLGRHVCQNGIRR